jgi:hypothetical protein
VDSKAIRKYLVRQAEPEARAAEALAGAFGHVLVVPAYGEGQGLFEMLGSVPRGPAGETLVVVVLNARADSPPAVHEANTTARDRLREEAAGAVEIPAEHPVSALPYAHGRILLVDRAARGHYLPEGQGVGLARKIGNDLALRLHAAGRVASHWIHNTDADTILPNDYFDQTEGVTGEETAAALYFFEHRFSEDETLGEAARLYEISLRYYVLGLAWAGSPYAYQSMGSCIAVRPWAYAEVHGFPKKNAAEDFYALNKLAKVGMIERLAGSPLLLEGRLSDRVPFGTGKALTQLVSKHKGLSSFRLYHPMVFAHLSAWLRLLGAAATSKGDFQAALSELPGTNPFFRSDLLLESLEKMGAFPALREAVERSPDAKAMRRHFHTWFDSFRTRKLIHALRDGGLSSLPWREAVAEAPFTGLAASTVDEAEPLRNLLAAREREVATGPAGVPALENA